MIADEEKPAAADAAPLRIQFSLGTLLLLPVIAGCAMAVLFTKPFNVAAKELYIIAFLLPAILTGGIVYGKGYTRAFCIGALFPAGMLFLYSTMQFTDVLFGQVQDYNTFFTLQCLFGGSWLAAVVSGCMCMGIRWLAQEAVGSRRRRGWGRTILVLLLVLLILSGPIVGRIGISLGWWKAETPSPITYSQPNPYGAPVPYTAPTTGYYPSPYSPNAAPVTQYPNPTSPNLQPAPAGADGSNSNSPNSPRVIQP
jgi:hypothetical protein